MKKHLIATALILMQTVVIADAKPFGNINTTPASQWQQIGLEEYTGKYEMKQGAQTVTSDVYIKNGKLMAKSPDGQILTLDRVSGDNFVIASQGTEIKFIRDKQNKVSQVSVMGTIAWTKADNKIQHTEKAQPADLSEYTGKYQATANGHTLIIEVSIKSGQLWATQLWDAAGSALDFVSADKFIVNALSVPLKFTRNSNKKVTQLVLNGSDVFTRI